MALVSPQLRDRYSTQQNYDIHGLYTALQYHHYQRYHNYFILNSSFVFHEPHEGDNLRYAT